MSDVGDLIPTRRLPCSSPRLNRSGPRLRPLRALSRSIVSSILAPPLPPHSSSFILLIPGSQVDGSLKPEGTMQPSAATVQLEEDDEDGADEDEGLPQITDKRKVTKTGKKNPGVRDFHCFQVPLFTPSSQRCGRCQDYGTLVVCQRFGCYQCLCIERSGGVIGCVARSDVLDERTQLVREDFLCIMCSKRNPKVRPLNPFSLSVANKSSWWDSTSFEEWA